MDTSVQEIGTAVVVALKAAGYKESTIGQYQKSIKQLETLATHHDGAYTCELGAQFASMTTSPRTGPTRFTAYCCELRSEHRSECKNRAKEAWT